MKWWNDLTKEEQQQYLLDHPKSKLKVKGKDNPDPDENEPLLSDEELDALTKQVDTSLEDDEDYQNNKKIVGNYVNNNANDGLDGTTVKKLRKTGIISVKSLKKKTAKIKIKKVAGAKGYQIKYSDSKKYRGYITKNVTKRTVTIKKLDRKTKFYFKVRAYTKVGTKKVYGAWSKTKSVKVK
jgi:hypothetical protein